MKRAKLAELLRKDYVQTVIMIAITIVSVIVFWYGLRFAFRTEHPLLAVASGSMKPTLYEGDLILVQGGLKPPYSEIDVGYTNGTIIVFDGDAIGKHNLIVHRAIDKDYKDGVWYFKTHGDNNPHNSVEEFSEDYLIGKVVGRVPLLGHIALFFEPFEVKVAFILFWIILLIILELVPLSRKKVEEEQDQTKPL